MFNTGYQANLQIAEFGYDPIPGWRTDIVALFAGFDHTNWYSNFLHGAVYYVPIFIVTYLGGFIWEGLFAWKRGHEVNEGFFVTGILFTLILPPTIPLWMVFLGISFGVVVGKEIFGGTGKNFLNPALVGRAFLFFAYPAQMSGDAIWTAVDGFSGATPLALAAARASWTTAAGLNGSGRHHERRRPDLDADRAGRHPGLDGRDLAAADRAGRGHPAGDQDRLLAHHAEHAAGHGRHGHVFNMIGSDTNPMFDMPWYWHLSWAASPSAWCSWPPTRSRPR
jgi:Na+-transporting NADH:ubiquinone oxidoreductase subunit B